MLYSYLQVNACWYIMHQSNPKVRGGGGGGCAIILALIYLTWIIRITLYMAKFWLCN